MADHDDYASAGGDPVNIQVGSPRSLNVLVALPFMSGLLDGQRVMRHAVKAATVLLNGRVDPRLAAPDQVIPTWVIARAKARGVGGSGGVTTLKTGWAEGRSLL